MNRFNLHSQHDERSGSTTEKPGSRTCPCRYDAVPKVKSKCTESNLRHRLCAANRKSHKASILLFSKANQKKKKKKMPENVRAQIHMLVFGCCHYSSVHPEIVAPHPSNFLRKQLFDFSSESNFLASFVLRRRPRRHFPPYRNGTITPPVHDRFIPNVMYSLLASSHTQNSLDYDFSTSPITLSRT